MSKTGKPKTEVASKSIKNRKRYYSVQGDITTSKTLAQPIEGGESILVGKKTNERKIARIQLKKNLFSSRRRRLLEQSRRHSGKAPQPAFPGSGVIDVSASITAEREPQPPTDLKQLAIEVLGNPSAWFSTPNSNLGSRKPADLIGTEEEHKVFDLLYAVDQGSF